MSLAFPPKPVAAQDTAKPEFEMIWSIDGGPYGSSRSLEPTLAMTADKVLIAANVTKGDRRHQVIRAFDIGTGRPTGLVEHPEGKPFEGLGDVIAVNERFMVTSLHRKPQVGGEGELLVYDAGSLDLLRRIQNPRRAESGFFGSTDIALYDDKILATVLQSDDNRSTAWVFSAHTGEVLLTIDEPNVPQMFLRKPPVAFFGRSVAMNATHIAISANDRDGPAGLNARGIVYVFDAADGSLLYQLKTPGSEKAFGFGSTLVMSEDRLYVDDTDETGELDWPTNQVHAYDLNSGNLVFSIEDPGAPKTLDEFSDGMEGWGVGTNLEVDGPYLFSGLPDWSGSEPYQGGLIVFDARTGERLLTYQHQSGEANAAFGRAIAVDHGKLAVMEQISSGNASAARVRLFRVSQP